MVNKPFIRKSSIYKTGKLDKIYNYKDIQQKLPYNLTGKIMFMVISLDDPNLDIKSDKDVIINDIPRDNMRYKTYFKNFIEYITKL